MPTLSTPERILDVTERLCADVGIEAVSMRDIAAAAEVSIPVIYHHFKSRNNLLRELVRSRFAKLLQPSYVARLADLASQPHPALRDVLMAVLGPYDALHRPGRESALQFHALALVCPMPEIRDELDAGVVQLREVVALLQRALPNMSPEDICWRLHFTMKITHLTALDAARLGILSNGTCNGDDGDEILVRSLAFAEAAFLGPAIVSRTSGKIGRRSSSSGRRAKSTAPRRHRASPASRK